MFTRRNGPDSRMHDYSNQSNTRNSYYTDPRMVSNPRLSTSHKIRGSRSGRSNAPPLSSSSTKIRKNSEILSILVSNDYKITQQTETLSRVGNTAQYNARTLLDIKDSMRRDKFCCIVFSLILFLLMIAILVLIILTYHKVNDITSHNN